VAFLLVTATAALAAVGCVAAAGFVAPRAHHGFNGIDGAVVSTVAGFAAR
jgi:hypothetical protein